MTHQPGRTECQFQMELTLSRVAEIASRYLADSDGREAMLEIITALEEGGVEIPKASGLGRLDWRLAVTANAPHPGEEYRR